MCLFYFAFARFSYLRVSMVYGFDLNRPKFHRCRTLGGRSKSLGRHGGHLCPMKFSTFIWWEDSDPGTNH